ncbi:MAG: hypothetical protein O7G83_18325, partial [Proteobacteria bacterium]|nr:hypothetical protein [Pseudomonadota bacterium]
SSVATSPPGADLNSRQAGSKGGGQDARRYASHAAPLNHLATNAGEICGLRSGGQLYSNPQKCTTHKPGWPALCGQGGAGCVTRPRNRAVFAQAVPPISRAAIP